jgi:hypothetical protein
MADADLAKPPLHENHVQALAALFSIPQSHTKRFHRMLEAATKEAWRAHRATTHKLPRAPRIREILERARNWHERSRPQRAHAILSKGGRASDAAAALLIAAGRIDADLGEWLEAAPPEAVAKAFDHAVGIATKQFRGRGRAPGTRENPAFDAFVLELYFYVAALGGDVGTTSSKKGAMPVPGKFFQQSGPNRGAITRLNNMGQLPPGFVPTTENSKLNALQKAKAAYLSLGPI